MDRHFSQRSKVDTRRSFTDKKYALLCAQILQHMTGDRCMVISKGDAHHYILRQSGDKVGRG